MPVMRAIWGITTSAHSIDAASPSGVSSRLTRPLPGPENSKIASF